MERSANLFFWELISDKADFQCVQFLMHPSTFSSRLPKLFSLRWHISSYQTENEDGHHAWNQRILSEFNCGVYVTFKKPSDSHEIESFPLLLFVPPHPFLKILFSSSPVLSDSIYNSHCGVVHLSREWTWRQVSTSFFLLLTLRKEKQISNNKIRYNSFSDSL